MNLEKLLELLFVLIAELLRLLLGHHSSQRICTMPLNSQMAAA
jgi:hypothetical protein